MKKRFGSLAAIMLVAMLAFAVCALTACGEEEKKPAPSTPGLTDDDDYTDDDGETLTLTNRARYEAEYAVLDGTPADKKKGFVRQRNDMSGKYVLVRLSVPGNSVTFTVNADKAEAGVKLTACIAAMNVSSNANAQHREADFDSVYRLNVNGADCPQNVKYAWPGEKKELWFDMVEVELTIDLIAGENVIKFVVPDLPADVAGAEGVNPSVYVGANFDYIFFETESAQLTYSPNYNNALE